MFKKYLFWSGISVAELKCSADFFCFLILLIQHMTIDSVLARGEKLDSLVEKSSDLSMASQACKAYLPCICKSTFGHETLRNLDMHQ